MQVFLAAAKEPCCLRCRYIRHFWTEFPLQASDNGTSGSSEKVREPAHDSFALVRPTLAGNHIANPSPVVGCPPMKQVLGNFFLILPGDAIDIDEF